MNKYLLKYYFVLLVLFASTGMLWADSIYKAVSDTFSISINDYLFVKTIDTNVNVDLLVNIDKYNKRAQQKALLTQPEESKLPDSAEFSNPQVNNTEMSIAHNVGSLLASQDTSFINDSNESCIDSMKTFGGGKNKDDVNPQLCRIEKIIEAPVPQILSEWVFPLVIMLFAFGFPLILDFINKVENKYNIEVISSAITKSGIYKWYIGSLILSISSSIIFCILLFIDPSNAVRLQHVVPLLKNITTVTAFIASIITIIASIILVRKMFLYNDVNALYKEKNQALEKKFTNKDNIRVLLAIYDYAIKHEINDLLNNIEMFLKSQIDKYRKSTSDFSKFSNRNEIEYPSYLIEGLETICKNTLNNDNGINNQNRLVQLFCCLLFEKTEKKGLLPKTIISNSSLKYFWCIVKLTIDKNNAVAFSILWSNICSYYKQLNELNTSSRQLQQERTKIENICFIIGAYNYWTKSFDNLQLMLTEDLNISDELSLTHIEDILLQYYRCTGDFNSPKISSMNESYDAYSKYVIIEKSGTTKKQQIEPISLYASYLIHRIFNKGSYFLQFDPIKFINALLDIEKKTFRPTNNLRDALIITDKFNDLSCTDLKIESFMSEDDVKTLYYNLVMQTEQQENIRLYHTPISDYWDKKFRERLNIEWRVFSREMKSLCTIQETDIAENLFSGTNTYNYDNAQSEKYEVVPFLEDSITFLCAKKHFVYATYSNEENNQYGVARELARTLRTELNNKMINILLEMKEERSIWSKTRENLLEKIDALTSNNQCLAIVYFSLKKDSENVVDHLLKSESYTSLGAFGPTYYNNVPIYFISGKELTEEQYKSLKKSFIIITRNNSPIYTYSRKKSNSEYDIQYSSLLANGEAKLKISIQANAEIKYRKNTAKLIKVKFN